MRERFGAVPTAALVDVMDDLGRREQTLPAPIRPLADGMRLAGEAFTVEGAPSEHDDWDAAVRKTLAMLGAVPTGHVAVYQCHHDRSAHFGELSATSLASRGVAGCVIDGGCRDVRLIEAEGFPVFTRFVTPEDSTWRWEVTATQEPITIGTVRIEPGDWVVGDEDGVVVVPLDIAAGVLAAAEAKVGTESAIRVAVRDGMSPLDAYERFGTF
ncbi:MAG TPA: RraA family protein [Gaiella sp.]|uniref:RraA family protein n=1 Tax=Gaiella sp. TaxID=2663207 RepID=UPI002D7E7115|nr:RraA family protein [Gaiella sp.]HET9286289.1 RraA family protein [Gaiella sp.]